MPKLSSSVASFLTNNLGWKSLTTIQKKAIPEIISGKNVLIIAGTASGKTEAAMIPILQKMSKNRGKGIICIYFAPLKALINDIAQRLKGIFERFDFYVGKWHGDVSQSDKIYALKEAKILVTTPESMEGLLTSKKFSPEIFSDLRFVVIDEVHNFANNPRGAQLMSLIERLQIISRNEIQRVAMSATVGNPEKLLQWITGCSERESVVIETNSASRREINVRKEEEIELSDLVKNLLSENKKIIIFADSRKEVEHYTRKLLDSGIEALPHHSSVSKTIRESIEKAFKANDKSCVIVATSTLELGIDVGNVDTVIFLNVPYSTSSFLQRIGRSGRKSKLSKAWILIPREEDLIRFLGIATMLQDGEVEKVRPLWYYPQLFAHQIIALTYEKQKLLIEHLKVLKNASPFKEIKKDDFELLRDHLLNKHYLELNSENYLVPGSETLEIMESGYKKKNFVVLFPTTVDFIVYHKGVEIGTLHPIFAQTLQESFQKEGYAVFSLAKENWRVEKIDTRKRKIDVVPTNESQIPKWMSFGSKMDFDFAQAIRKALISQEIPKNVNVSETIKSELLDLMDVEKNTVAADRYLVTSQLATPNMYEIDVFTYFGNQGNLLLKYLIKMLGIEKIKINWRSINIKSEKSIDRILAGLKELISKPDSEILDLLTAFLLKNNKEISTLYLQLGDTLKRYIPPELQARSLAKYLLDDRVVDALRSDLVGES
ncbi:DEAD/DEAH box helicase [Kosmotoga sp.]|uniref:DEAD/DEAH box helicase n=1 Tax=Kosmotoga sp. TaxID=1955248 RepID=UPI0024AC2E33|nr:DEAD/DEAH box helicase [Kosmotoga sp.]MDI3523750.1 ATP-dependent helicase Lhr and Lhr-like helicase [Kosmotoga sp.]MDK2953385.1 ATP-dependent helicase Lhr and Lhr-like helicase [Kosmotoga sp.]